MIVFDKVCKSYTTRHGRFNVLREIDLTIKRGQKMGLLGLNGAGKSTLLRLIGGAERPTRGAVTRGMSVSWPLAFSGAFQGSLTGMDNLRFICRVYGVDAQTKLAYVDEFAELGRFMFEPVRTYSAGMRARLAFAISMAIDFDCYLIDEVLAVGDARFQEKCGIELFEKRADRAMVIASHVAETLVQHCDSALLVHGGGVHAYSDVPKALEAYAQLHNPATETART
jgi:capsular polysaccharide transport system ATP-binding protein